MSMLLQFLHVADIKIAAISIYLCLFFLFLSTVGRCTYVYIDIIHSSCACVCDFACDYWQQLFSYSLL